METIRKAFVTLLLFIGGISAASAATLYLSPASGTYTIGKNFTVSVRVNTSQAMNAADGVINFPTDKLTVVGLSKSGSIFNLWVQEPSYSNSGQLGNVRFEGVVLNPGFTGDGKILDITFAAKSKGIANVTFASGSVLANDGQGTNILSALNSGSYTMQEASSQNPEIVAPGSLPPRPSLKHYIKGSGGELVLFHTSENGIKWSNSSFAKLVWALPAGTTGLATLLNDDPESNSGTKSEGFFDSKTFSVLEEGKHYFHIRFINNKGAGPILHYPLFIDTVPPKSFSIKFANKTEDNNSTNYSTSNPRLQITFSTSDDLSGVDHYELKIDNGEWVKADSFMTLSGIYVLPKQKPGMRTITARAFDKAGNFTDTASQVFIEPIIPPVIVYYPRHITSPGEKLLIRGTGSPNASIEIKLTKNSNEPTLLNTKTDDNGSWTIIYDEILPSGTYAITAKQILANGAESLETDPVYMSVNSLFWKLWQWLKNVGGFAVVLLFFLALLMLLTYYYWHRFRMLRRRLRREFREAEEALHHGLSRVRKELEKGETRERVTKDLGVVQKEVEKEIKDVEKRLK